MSQKSDRFFDTGNCDRCHKAFHHGDSRIMSWFTDDTLCERCSAAEDEHKRAMRASGLNPDDFEGCGYIPKIPS